MIEYLYIIIIALSIGLVAFNAAFWGGIYKCLCVSEVFMAAIAFLIFQAGFFWLGSWSGNSFAHTMGWLAIPFAETIILLTGVKLIYSAFRARPEQKSYDLSRYGELVAVSFASSLNAFVIGLGYGLLRPVSGEYIAAITVITAILSVAGMYMGKRNGRIIYTTFTGLAAGLLLILLAVLLALHLNEML